MRMTPTLRSIISQKQDAETIKEQAMKEGMRTLRMSGSEYVIDGTTSYAEALRISFDS
jgi:type IV pilus assembly protein PilB